MRFHRKPLGRIFVADSDAFNQYLDRAVKHYSSLFTLPSYRNIVVFSALICLAAGSASALILSPSYLGLIIGLLLGVILFAITALLNYFLRFLVLKKDPIYDLRRVSALSLYCWILWLFFIFMGCGAAVFYGAVWAIRLYLIGFSAVLILRLIVLYVTSTSGFKRFLIASIIPPFLCLAPLMSLWLDVADFWRITLFLFYALGVALVSSYLFFFFLNSVGRRAVGFSSLSIFKAFLMNWIADLNAPFEVFLENLSEEQDVNVSVLRFDGSNGKAFMVVPSVHPGPFKNIGSSLLPSMLKKALEQKFGGVACVPLGLLGHELDLASQVQSQKIIDCVVESAFFKVDEDRATPFVKVKNGLATACCQVFGKTAFIALSLAPSTTEDLPRELGSIIQREARRHGLKACVVVNAHNSINGPLDSKQAFEALEAAAKACLEKAVSMDRQPFKIGAATIMPKDFGLAEGMGPGGITVLVVEVGGQKAAYVIFDGNNMVSGLRDKILSALQTMGVDEGEVFTTDTHSVNAVTLNARGYHPIGEVIDHERLIEYVKEAARTALASLEPARVGFRDVVVQNVKVIGQDALEKLCLLPDIVIRWAKRVVVPLFALTFLLLMLFLLWI
jgi:putative membrane protein